MKESYENSEVKEKSEPLLLPVKIRVPVANESTPLVFSVDRLDSRLNVRKPYQKWSLSPISQCLD